MKEIAIISNQRMFFLYCLLTNKNVEDVFFIFEKGAMPNNLTSISHFIVLDHSKSECYDFFYFNFISCKYRLRGLDVYGADHIKGAKFFLERHRFFVVEDGMMNYSKNMYAFSLFRTRNPVILPGGFHPNVKTIFLTKDNPIPDQIAHKREIINIKTLWQAKTATEKTKILSFFEIDMQEISVIKNRSFVLYTQPLSEDKLLTEAEKIDIYRTILTKYNHSQTVIKPHPRDKTDYKQLFPDAYVMKGTYPSELLTLLGVNFNKVITLFSTAVFDYPKEKIDFYGTAVHPKLLDFFD
ncbi:hypothetical protein A6046_02050 [[Haemophilus] ducreyi]|uniref:Lipooligosaccharide sialyltransferase n=3 Tax=Haemophilus ducreyi TaxID=730 RepID=G1UBB5_HAEDU|nr:glycosyltransferase family 52 protein [[Haemophilus] ducreyi]AAD28703.1 lipooligosaccharide sialyltransferase [[Haemophilus] ducreyi]AAP95605.1 lipooligosaccharide sialyltransferase [[Haemophilus] ducreyi 35000HP]AKO32117.1 hypothetical protein RZ57_02685 [[Haemophilus] ducreyi]AKO35018.1 hypothetical protein RZ59_02665 [[Haemophilus] ducreyi]AKO36450.1 hypothetical protein RZ61_02705 [[Haemophilus] ducreyi]